MALPPDLAILRGKFTASVSSGCRLLHRVHEQVADGSHPALQYRDERLSHSELSACASRLARALVRRVVAATAAPQSNVDGDVIVAVGMPPSERLVVTLLAVWKAGAAYLPLDSAFAANRVQHILGEAQPVLVISDLVDSDMFQGVAHTTYADLAAEAAMLSAEPLADVEMLVPSTDVTLAIVCYTSGSSGIPKGVRIPHSAVLNRLSWQWQEFPYDAEEDIFVFKTALTFVDSVAELWGPLLQGRTVIVLDRELTANTERFVRTLHEHRIQRLVVVPSQLRAILLFLEMDAVNRSRMNPLLTRLQFWVSTGEPLPLDLAQRFFTHFSGLGLDHHILCNSYGSTEVMGDVTFHMLHSAADLRGLESVPIGRPLYNTTVYILDENLRPALADQSGELFVAGANVAAGYVAGRDSLKFIQNPLVVLQDPEHYSLLYRTGDFGRMTNGVLEYEGRADTQVKVRGRRVHLSEVETAMERIEEVNQAVVLCYRPGEEQQEIVAFVTLHAGSSLTGRLVETFLRSSLPAYAVPHVLVTEHIPLLPNGKVDRQALLRSHAESQMEPDYSGMPEGCVIATHVLLDTVAAVLGASARMRISLDRSFFELGGDSLNSVSTVSRLRELGYFINVGDFIKAKTLLEALEKLKPIEGDSPSLADASHHSKFHAEPLKPHHKKDVYSIITDGFLQKGDLEMWIHPHISPSEYYERMDMIWDELLLKNLSFVATDSSGAVVGCALLFDARDEPKVTMSGNRLSIIFNFLAAVEDPIWAQKLPPGVGQVLHSLMLCTSGRLTPRQNVLAMQFLEGEVLRCAKERGYLAVLTTNTSPLTQQLGRDVFNYQTLLDYQVNQYVAPDGSRPFEKAPDDQRVFVAWKTVNN